jgi:serine/threonine protein kinase
MGQVDVHCDPPHILLGGSPPACLSFVKIRRTPHEVLGCEYKLSTGECFPPRFLQFLPHHLNIYAMEVIEKSEAFAPDGNDIVFHHTKVILRSKGDGQYFYSRTPKRIPSSTVTFDDLDLNKIPTEDIWPVVNPTFTRAPQPLPPDSYIKRPSLLEYGDSPASCKINDQILNEVDVCEILMNNPHPNIGQYLGCIVEGDRITGLCFTMYEMTLFEKQRRSLPFDRAACLRGIKCGVRHLHKLGLVHNDLNPRNIMMKADNPVIIDFDSCRRQGQELGLKGGTKGWALEGVTHAEYDNDLYGLDKIREFLMQEV